MSQPKIRIEDEILRVLLLLIAKRRSKGEKEIDQRTLTNEALTEIETDAGSETDEQAALARVPQSLLQLVLKPDLPAAVLEMIAKLLNNDPDAHRALVKLLTSTSTPSNVRRALTAVLAKCTEHGYSNAENVLREALIESKDLSVSKQLTATIQRTSRYTADYFKLLPQPTMAPTPKPKGYPYG